MVLHSIAGGDEALVRSMEAPEDDWEAGLSILQRLQDDESVQNVVFVGISCGFSANYVAGKKRLCRSCGLNLSRGFTVYHHIA